MQDTTVIELTIFTILALFMLGGAIAMITNKQTIYSAFGFLVAMMALAGLFALLDSRFLAVAQIMVSVGAVVVLSMLTILTVNVKEIHLPPEPYKYRWILLSTLIVSPFTLLLYKALSSLPSHFMQTQTMSSKFIGKLLFSEWILPFEMVSILLLCAMIGAIVIAKKELSKKELSKKGVQT